MANGSRVDCRIAHSQNAAFDNVATGSYFLRMDKKVSRSVPMKEAKNSFAELVRHAEGGETIVITRNGTPVADIVPHKKRGGINFEAGRAYLKSIGVTDPVPYISPDFDDPLPEDFLITPLPPEFK